MIYFIGAGPGDPELLTIKAKNILERADMILYTGSLIPKEILSFAKKDAIIKSSESLKYDDIFYCLKKYANTTLVRLHTGDPSLYSTIAKQIEFLKREKIAYEVIPGVSASFGASASLGIEYTIPGVSQTLILTRIEGNTPNPEQLENILNCKNSSIVFYLSINLIAKLKEVAYKLNYPKTTPCWVIERATWVNEKVYKGTIEDIEEQVKDINGIALILFGEFLNQKEAVSSHLYRV